MKPSAPDETPGPKPGVSSLRILAVDDDPAEFALLEDGFARCGVGIELATATTAPLAIVELHLAGHEGRPHVALVDIGMPLVSGFELARQLVAEDIPTILMSSHVDGARAAMAREIGALDLLAKPVDGPGYGAFAARVLRMLR